MSHATGQVIAFFCVVVIFGGKNHFVVDCTVSIAHATFCHAEISVIETVLGNVP